MMLKCFTWYSMCSKLWWVVFALALRGSWDWSRYGWCVCFPKLRNTFTRKQQYYSSCCLGNLTNHFFFCIVTKCTTSKLSSVCFFRVRPTWSSLGQTVPGKWTESYRGRRLQVCVSPACCPTHCPNIYCTLWGYDQFWDGIILSSA